MAGDPPKRLLLLTKLHDVRSNDCSLGKITVWYLDGFFRKINKFRLNGRAHLWDLNVFGTRLDGGWY